MSQVSDPRTASGANIPPNSLLVMNVDESRGLVPLQPARTRQRESLGMGRGTRHRTILGYKCLVLR